MVPRKGLEPPLSYREADFKSAASTIPPPGHFTFQLLNQSAYYNGLRVRNVPWLDLMNNDQFCQTTETKLSVV